jgi:hypothetical protein
MRTTMMISLGGVVAGAIAARPAHAEPFSYTDEEIVVVEPTGQNERATLTTMPWCPAGAYHLEAWDKQRLRRQVYGYDNYDSWADAAEHFCEHKTDPSWRKQMTSIVQLWINAATVSQADAEVQIAKKIDKLHVDKDNEGKPPSDELRFAFAPSDLKEVKPEDGVAEAKLVGKPAWCDQARIATADAWDAGRIHRTVDTGAGIQGTVEGALHICQRPGDATWKTFAAMILQKWMNWTHLPQADAERSLRARVQIARFAAQRDELCKALEVGPEIAGEVKTYAEARGDLFGCHNSNQTLWQDSGRLNTGGVMYYLDGDTQIDELMRLYWLFGYVRDLAGKSLPAATADDNYPILYYAVAQNDFARLDTAAIDKTVQIAPYNEYARIVAMETVSVIRARERTYEKIIDKLTKGDEDYAAILRTAPRQAAAQWDQLAAQWKPEIERSNAFEKLLSQPSRKALKGCAPELTRDAGKVIKSFQINVYKDLVDKVAADPIANLLLGRLALCDAVDKVYGAPGALSDLISHGRNLRGPRALAYYAIVDAVAAAKTDRPRLVLDLPGFLQTASALAGELHVDARDLEISGRAPPASDRADRSTRGIVASTRRLEDGLQLTFRTVKLRWPDDSCVDDVHHPLRITADGRIEYFQRCRATGTVTTQDVTPAPLVISPLAAAGVAPGVFVQFVEASGHARNGSALGIVVLTRKSADDKTIQSFFGFGL